LARRGKVEVKSEKRAMSKKEKREKEDGRAKMRSEKRGKTKK